MRHSVILVGCILILAPTTLCAQQVSAVLPAAVAAPDHYTGNCPARIEFVGHVTVTVPGTFITYRWERSNGDSSKLFRVQIGSSGTRSGDSTSANITVAIPSDIWYLAQPGKSGSFWEALHVESPVDIRSRPASVTVTCRN